MPPVTATHPALHRAWALKEGLHTVFAIAKRSLAEAVEAPDRWISWARRCRLPQFVKLAHRVARNRDAIVASIEHGLSNALAESVNTKIRLIVRMAFGFHSVDAIAARDAQPRRPAARSSRQVISQTHASVRRALTSD